MYKIKYLVFSLCILIFSACKNQKTGNIEKVNDTKFTLNSFKKLPKEIDGCSCIFSKNEKEYAENNFVFASNFDSIAFVSINNKIVKLKLTSRTYKPNTVENEDYTCKYETKEYKVTIEIKADKTKKDAEESWWNKGLILIENKNGEKITQNFIGESGC
jgi:hypothetical protein